MAALRERIVGSGLGSMSTVHLQGEFSIKPPLASAGTEIFVIAPGGKWERQDGES